MKTKFTTKKLLALVLSLAMVLGMLPGMSLTAYADRTPTYKIQLSGQIGGILAEEATLPYATTVQAMANQFGATIQGPYELTKVENSTLNGDTLTLTGTGYSKLQCRDGYNAVSLIGITVTKNMLVNPISYVSTQTVEKPFSKTDQTATLEAATNGIGNVSYAINSQKNSSNANVTYFSLSGTTLTVAGNTPPGTYSVVVRATAAGDDDYASGSKDSTVTVTVNAHPHNFTYTADGATITAACDGAGDCDITEGLTMTISAPEGELRADGTKTFPATLSTNYNTTAFPGTYTITYTKNGAAYDGTPKEAGTYVASVTVGAAKASVSYTVAAPFTGEYGNYKPTGTENNDELVAKAVNFNGIEWFIIEDHSTAKDAGTLTLLAKDPIGGETKFGSNSDYSTSNVKSSLDALTATGGAFADVADAIVTTKIKASESDSEVDAKLWLFSVTQANSLSGNVRAYYAKNNNTHGWWLCTPGESEYDPYDGWTYKAAYIRTKTGETGYFNTTLSYDRYVRPALVLDLSKVTFDKTTQTFSLAAAHTHDFTYSASGATITATCANTDGNCTLPPSTEGGTDHVATLTIGAEGGTYDGTTAYGATVTNNIPAVTGDNVGDVAYYKVDTEGATTGGTAQAGAPTGAGYYYASVTLTSGDNTYTAVKAFTVAKADPYYTAPTGLNATYGQTLADVTLPTGWSWADDTQSVGDAGINNFNATFTPSDTDNYNVIENVSVTITVSKADPTANAPADLKAVCGQTLANVTLANPDGNTPGTWTWADDTLDVGSKGINTFKATFTPEDTDNYNIIEDIDVSVNVFEYYDEVPAECEKDGVTAYYEDGDGNKFSDLGETPLTDEQTVIEKLGHSFTKFFKWVWDGFDHAILWIACEHGEDHYETIDVPSYIGKTEGDLCTEGGYIHHVATSVIDDVLYYTINTETVDQLGHKWKESEWNIDGTKASVTLVCEHDPSHTKTVDAAVGVTVNEEGTLRTYTAKVTVDGVEYTKTWTEDITVPTPDVPTPDVPTPDEPTPDKPTPDEPTPDKPTPDEPTPDKPTPDEPTPDKPTPDEPTPDKPTPDEPTPDKPTPDEPEPSKEIKGILGDVNNDGQVDSADALMILRNSVGLETFDDTQRFLGDVNEDNENIDSSDALAVLRYSVGLIDIEKIGTPVSKTVA